MSVSLTGNGGVFVRLGHYAGFLADLLALEGAAATARVLSGASMTTRGTTLETDAAYSPAVTDRIDGIYAAINGWRGSQGSIFSAFRNAATAILVRQVDLDAVLASKDLNSALAELIRQMTANGTTINSSTVSLGSQTSVGTPTGTPVLVGSMKRYDGLTWQTPFAETIRFTVSADAQTGGATARQETLSIKGAAAIADPSDYQWPAGSGCAQSLNLCDAQKNNAGNNLLYNGAFETFTTANYPDNWTASVGAAGTDFFANGSGYTLNNALKLTGDASTLIALYQEFAHVASTSAGSGGTPFVLLPSTPYAVNFWLKVVTSAPLAGVLRVALVDGSNAVVNDSAGTANSFTADLTAATTGYVAYSGVFRTPAVLPTTLRLQLKTSTAISNTKSVVIDDLAMSKMTSLYSGGPLVAGFAGVTNCILADQWTMAVSDTMGAMAMWLERLFSLNSKGMIFPNTGSSPTVGDALVV